MAELYTIPKGGIRNDVAPVSDLNPLATYLAEDPSDIRSLPPVAGRSVFRQRVVPGIGTGAAYADKDIMGTIIEFPNMFRPGRHSGILLGGVYYDLDDEGLAVDLQLFSRQIASPAADNAAFAPSDAEVLAYRATLSFNVFSDFNTSQVSTDFRTLPIFSESTSLWGFMVARGALNIAAGHLPVFGLAMLPD